ncbi:hypothetical protein BS47DRAFT_1356503 [Hydnum rufescens UP504]|uniref:Uncharacterized protein n=1 Tax=Hydnum rufescens UP504 TaxID=1448309 RepID=A0A9P6ABI6_9AGAM|nr:hypothetical protein BS47DRAFT_1356503 [Hydnum rufescens UP504]
MFLPLLTILSLGTAAFIAVPEGTRLNVGVRGGNWTKPDGTLLAKVLGGLGGEHGYIDPTGTLDTPSNSFKTTSGAMSR